MPNVPQYNSKPLKTLYNASPGLVSMKQKNLILTLCEQRKLPIPDFMIMSKQEASQLISNMMGIKL